MVAPTVASVSSGNGTSDYTVNVPTGTTNGDLLIAIAASDWGTFAGNDVPAAFKTGTGGITLGTSDYDAGTNAFHIALGARIANSEPANYTFPADLSDHVAAIIRITGHDSTPVIAQIAPRTTGTGTEAPSIVPNGSDDLLLCAFGAEQNAGGARTWTPPTGMTEHVDRQSGTWTTLLVASLQSPANPSGVKTATPSAAVNVGAGCSISIKAAAAGGTNLVIQDSLHASVADNLGVTQNHLLLINDSRSTHTADNLVLTQAHNLSVQDALHSHTVDNLTVNSNINLAIQKATHAHTADVVDYTQVHQIAIHDALHTSTADNLVLAGGTTLTIQKATHAHSADGLVLVQTHNLSVHDAFHSTKADTISLVPPGTGGFMTVSDVQLQKLATLTGKTGSIQDLEHAYYGGLSGLVPATSFSVADHKRVYWETQTGLTGKSLADLEKAFYDLQAIAAGTLADREYTYWVSV